MSLEDAVRTDMIIDMRLAIIECIVDICKIHGKDPQLECIIASSMSLAIDDISTIYPNVKHVLVNLLENQD